MFRHQVNEKKVAQSNSADIIGQKGTISDGMRQSDKPSSRKHFECTATMKKSPTILTFRLQFDISKH